MKPMTYKELGEKVAEQALDDYLINGKTMREWINILSDNMSVLEQIRAEIDRLHYHPKLDFIKNDEVVEMALDIIDNYRGGKNEVN